MPGASTSSRSSTNGEGQRGVDGGEIARQHGLAASRTHDRIGEHCRLGILEEIAGGPGLHRPDDVGVGVIGREDEDGGGVGERGNEPGGSCPVQDGHAQIHEHHIGTQPGDHGQRLRSIGGLTDHLQAGLLGEHGHHAGPHHRVVVHDEEPDHRGTSTTTDVPPSGLLVSRMLPPTS